MHHVQRVCRLFNILKDNFKLVCSLETNRLLSGYVLGQDLATIRLGDYFVNRHRTAVPEIRAVSADGVSPAYVTPAFINAD